MKDRQNSQEQQPPVPPDFTGDPALDALLHIKHTTDNWEYQANQPIPNIVVEGVETTTGEPFYTSPPPQYREPLVTSYGLNAAARKISMVALASVVAIGAFGVSRVPSIPDAKAATSVPPNPDAEAIASSREDGSDPFIPTGNPLRDPKTVLTQGYGTGSHAPADTWGGIDLAIDADGDKDADPQATTDAPVYATHAGTIESHPNSWPGGNCVLLRSDEYRTTYCHLNGFTVPNGTQVQRGDLIGKTGSTGNSSGPHLHYEVWKDGVNQNPLEYGALEGIEQ